MDENPVGAHPPVTRRKRRYEHPVGVYRTAYGTWYVQISVGGERWYRGGYVTMEEAAAERDEFLKWKSGQSRGPAAQPGDVGEGE